MPEGWPVGQSSVMTEKEGLPNTAFGLYWPCELHRSRGSVPNAPVVAFG